MEDSDNDRLLEGEVIPILENGTMYVYRGTINEVSGEGDAYVYADGVVESVTGGNVHVIGGLVTNVSDGVVQIHEGTLTGVTGGTIYVEGGTIADATGGEFLIRGNDCTVTLGGDLNADSSDFYADDEGISFGNNLTIAQNGSMGLNYVKFTLLDANGNQLYPSPENQ